ncbi:hypothetical protein Bhyg_17196, partial [Pseudolycoriella hygida]
MWFRPGQMDTDRFRVSSFKNRMRRLKSPVKTVLNDEIEEESDKKQVVEIDDDNLTIIQRSPSGRRINKSDKDKLLLTDRKFKNNRVVKSSSKGKITDLEKRDSLKVRKISAPALDRVEATATVIVGSKKNVRSHSNLNLNALLRYRLSNKKLSHADIDRIRRKSLNGSSNATKSQKEKHNVDTECDKSDVDCYVNGNDDDEEVFHSCEEPETLKKTSPSLGARVAAHFNEQKTKRNKKKRKTSRTSLRSQNSFDRPTSTSVVRQPSDRRPDISNSSTTQSSVDFPHAHSVDTDSNAPDAEPAHRD